MDALKREFEYYIAKQQDFVRDYNGKVVVIKGQALFGVFDSLIEAMTAAKKEFAPGTFLVQRVSPDASEYTSTFHSRVAFQ